MGMKYIFLFLIISLSFSCKKNKRQDFEHRTLRFIMVDGKVIESFEYNGQRQLIKSASHFNCTDNPGSPTDEFFYIYNDTKLDTVKLILRSFYSSTTAWCDPNSGMKSYVTFEYDDLGRIKSTLSDNGVLITFIYNSQGFIERREIDESAGNIISYSYKYDNSGNISEVTDPQGNTSFYQFDNKINPYYSLNYRSGVITAFYNSPNNVVKITDQNSTSNINYEYNSAGLPVRMFDSNGQAYQYIYQ